MVCLSKQVVELEKSTHAQLVVVQGDVRVLRRKSWQRFRENRWQKRVELVNQHLNSGDSLGRLAINTLMSFAEFERDVAGKRTRDKIIATRRGRNLLCSRS